MFVLIAAFTYIACLVLDLGMALSEHGIPNEITKVTDQFSIN